MSSFYLNRRKFISSAGSVFILPLFESFLRSKAFSQSLSDPRRYVAIYFPNGTYNRGDYPTWYPKTGALTAANLTPVLSPFADMCQDFSVYKYIQTRAAESLGNQVGQHIAEAATFLTCDNTLTPQVSFEHIMANSTGKSALVLQGNIADQGDQPADNGISFLMGRMIRGISNPGDLYRELLGKVVTPATPTLVDNRSQSIIDSSLSDLNQLRAKLGQGDQQRLDDYLAGMRQLELKLKGSGSVGTANSSTCIAPVNNEKVDKSNGAQDSTLYLERMQMFNDLITIAFSCDITRSISIMLDIETGDRSLPNAPANLVYQGVDIAGWNNHLLSHFGHFSGGDFAHESPDGIPRCITRDRFYFSVVYDLMKKLKNGKDTSGSPILNNTIIHAGFGVKDGMHYTHLSEGAPLVVAGGRNFLSQGQAFDYRQFDVSDMFYSFNLKLNMGLTSFGGSQTTMPL